MDLNSLSQLSLLLTWMVNMSFLAKFCPESHSFVKSKMSAHKETSLKMIVLLLTVASCMALTPRIFLRSSQINLVILMRTIPKTRKRAMKICLGCRSSRLVLI